MGFAAKASRAPRPTAARARRRIARPVRASSSSPLHPGAGHVVGDLPSCVGWVRRLDRRGVAREFYVVGTVHTPGSASADEVRSVIERVKPNAVVLELDQERFDGVLATFMRDEDEDAMRRTRSQTPSPSSSSSSSTTSSTAGTFAPLSLPYALASSARGYGADFVAGAAAAEAIGALVVLGDAKARSLPDELRARMTDDPADLRRVLRSLRYVARAFGSRGETRVLNTDPEANETLLEPRSNDTNESARTVSFAAALAEDPGKLSPLAGPLSILALGAAAFVRDLAAPGGVHVSSTWIHAASTWLDVGLTLVAAVATARASEVLLEDRDGVLARSAARASACCDGMRRGRLRRVSYGFTADVEATATAAESAGPGPSGTPCFTLRSPLAARETRRLNLFEPRWLSLMDRLAAENGGELVGATLGCMLGVSRRYVAEDWLSRRRGNDGNTAAVDSMRTAAVDSNESEGRPSYEPGAAPPEISRTTRRSADIVIEPWMRLARVTKCEEGKRAVTGARKLEVWIEGLADEDPSGPGFVPAVASVTAHPAGYLCAQTTSGRNGEDVVEEETAAWGEWGESTERQTDEPVRVVCVVGLAHCNGVVDRLAAMDLERWR